MDKYYFPAPVNKDEPIKVPAGTHQARCYLMIMIGTLVSEVFGTKSTKMRIGWELCNELMENGKPLVIGRTYTYSLSKKSSLIADLESWRGKPFSDRERKGFNMGNLIGAPCLINVIHKDKRDGSGTYASVEAITPLPKGMTVAELIHEPIVSTYDRWNEDAYNKLPGWLQKEMQRTPEYNQLRNPAASPPKKEPEPIGDIIDDLPF
jgi:hypothetical protein